MRETVCRSTLPWDVHSATCTIKAVPTVELKPIQGWVGLHLRELWQFRELLVFLVWRDIKVRYNQTVLGIIWALLQPLLTMLVFTLFFAQYTHMSAGSTVPYPLFSLAGLLPWTFFSRGLSAASASVVGSANLLRKIYFPRLLIPTAAVLPAAVDLLLSLGLMGALFAIYSTWPSSHVWLLPLCILALITVTLGAGLWLSALNLKYRDVGYALPFLIQLCLFASPLIYPTERALTKFRSLGLPSWLYGLNPMVGILDAFRWTLLGHYPVDVPVLIASVVVSASVTVSGAFYFRRMERQFADLV